METVEALLSESDVVVVERRDNSIWVTLNRPDAANALKPPATFRAFERVFECIRSDESIKALVIAAAGDRAFCIGSDLSFLEDAFRTRNFAAFRDYLHEFNACLLALEDLPVPTVAMVQGKARAGGFELILACDFVLLADDVWIGDVHTPYGHMPGAGATQRLARKVGIQKAMDIILTGRWISAEEAVMCGLALKRVPRDALRRVTTEFTAQFADKIRDSLRFSKSALLRGWDLPLRDGIRLEMQSYLEYLATCESPVEMFWSNQARRGRGTGH
jgi:enoyl-CoA hydratase/carnithine racemase